MALSHDELQGLIRGYPINWDPVDMIGKIWEVIKPEERVVLARAELSFRRQMLQAQLDYVNTLEGFADQLVR